MSKSNTQITVDTLDKEVGKARKRLSAALAASTKAREVYTEKQIDFESAARNLEQQTEEAVMIAYRELSPVDYTLPDSASPVSESIIMSIVRARAYQTVEYKNASSRFAKAQEELANAELVMHNKAEAFVAARDEAKMVTSWLNLHAPTK